MWNHDLTVIFSQNYESHPMSFSFQSCWQPDTILIVESFYETSFSFLKFFGAFSLGLFHILSIIAMHLFHDTRYAGSSGSTIHKCMSFTLRKYSQVVTLILLLFLFCFWNSYCSDIQPSEVVFWFRIVGFFLGGGHWGFFFKPSYILSLALWFLVVMVGFVLFLLNPCHSSNLRHCSDNAGSLTC